MIEVIDLKKSYGDCEAVRGVSFEVQPGEIVGLLGPNGAGKTTIMKVLTCFHFPSEGSAKIDGIDVTENPLDVKRRVGYLPENAPIYADLTVSEYLSFIADARELEGKKREERIEWVIAKTGIESVIHKPIDTLSKGFRQRVGLAQAIIHDPAILILDEPTTGLDPNQIIEIRALIRELGKEKTVILSTHILQEVEAVCGRVLILNDGVIAAQGTTNEIGNMLSGGSGTRFDLKLKGKGVAAIKTALKSLKGFSSVERVSETEGKVVEARIVVEGSDEEAIFDWAVANELKLLESKQAKFSLEDIFVKLTTDKGVE